MKKKGKVADFSKENFSNIGNTCSMIMDIIDDCVNDFPIRYPALNARAFQKKPLYAEIYRRTIQLTKQFVSNYCVKYPDVGNIWKIASKIWHLVFK